MSASLNANPDIAGRWDVETVADVAISGNKLTITTHPDEHTTVMEYTITAINGSELTANQKFTAMVDGEVGESELEKREGAVVKCRCY